MGRPADAQLGLLGRHIRYSRSPALHQAALDALGIPARYALWPTEPADLAARVDALRAPGMLGANVTIPYKTDVLPLLDVLAEEVRGGSGAVNTITRDEQPGLPVRLVGHNTDVPALARVLRELEAPTAARGGGQMLVLGAGGAARAAAQVARQRGDALTLAARRPTAAEAVLRTLAASAPLPDGWGVLDLGDVEALATALPRTDVLVNATPIGTDAPEASPLPLGLLRHLPAHALVVDLIYSPPETALVRAARARGLRATGGLAMLLYQGALAFELWTGQPAPLEVMRAAIASP